MNRPAPQKPLSPTLKEKKRYLAYRLDSEKSLPINAGNLLLHDLKRSLGVFDAAEAGLMSITYDPKTTTGVLRTSLKGEKKAKASLLLVTELSNTRVSAHPLLTSGVLAKAKAATKTINQIVR